MGRGEPVAGGGRATFTESGGDATENPMLATRTLPVVMATLLHGASPRLAAGGNALARPVPDRTDPAHPIAPVPHAAQPWCFEQGIA